MQSNSDLLVGLSDDELEALADSVLVPSKQALLDDLLNLNAQGLLDNSELRELDRLISHVDHLSILKSRARYTLSFTD